MKKQFALFLAGFMSLAIGGCSNSDRFSTEAFDINDTFNDVNVDIKASSLEVYENVSSRPKFFQVLTFEELEDLSYSKEMFSVMDFNFDGNADICMPSHRGNKNVYNYVWLWDESINGFLLNDKLSSLSLLSVDEQAKLIHAFEAQSASDSVESTYDWVDGNLTLLNEVSVTADLETGKILEKTTQRITDGSYNETINYLQ